VGGRYSAGLREARHITLPYERPGYRHVYHLYVIETRRPEQRDPLLEFLNKNGIDAKCHYPIAIHQQEGYPWGKERASWGAIPNSSATRPAASPADVPRTLSRKRWTTPSRKCSSGDKANP
jgi:dTDP-4-amino-4,6-dideoxygalactose transaminase